MNIFIIFPVHLFELEYLEKIENIENMKLILIEEPIYFGEHKIEMNFNKIKLVLHRASMKYYFDYLKHHKFNVEYLDVNKVNYKRIIKKNYKINIFDPTDHYLQEKLEHICKSQKAELIIHQNPNFLLKSEDLDEYNKKYKSYFHKVFYEWHKKKLNSKIKGSYDTMNRNKYDGKYKVPKLPVIKTNKYISEAKRYVEKHFKNNYGSVEDFIYAITHKDAKKWFSNFLKNKLYKFGEYQDSIYHSEKNNYDFMFHSVISPMLNIGLLNPDYIIDKLDRFYNKNKSKISINNYEGFYRQVIGWREYQRLIYKHKYQEITKSNFFNNTRKLTDAWYIGETGILPLDNAIKKAFKYGYLHHIERLMIVANLMNLIGLKPIEAYKWFMEFSADSYDWVMIGNVYSMGMFADGGLTMRKPYISSGNYIEKMSNYERGDWFEKWRVLFYNFINKHKNFIKHTQLNNNLNYLKTINVSEITTQAEKIIKDITK